MNAFAIIPARGGSKGLPKKSIALLGGFPLIAYSIAVAKLSKKVERVIVSTDSEEMAEVARSFGAETPFMRPAEFARDDSPDIEFVRHAIEWLKENENQVPEYLVHLRPTTPLRKPNDIDSAIEMLTEHKDATSLRSGHEIRESPFKLFGIKDGYFTGLFPQDSRPEYWNLPRQTFPPVYQPDGYVDVLRTDFIQKTHVMHGNKILAFVSPDTGEIDKQEDFAFAEYTLKNGSWEIYDYLKKNFS
ncbi:MAG: acylneuraminate cytidylyltransferase family protein [bacterium]|nr:acylneuraminate cytidylyltransferase family protein [bacterium]